MYCASMPRRASGYGNVSFGPPVELKSHPSSANAAPTPASDGEAIYAFYSSNDLICLDLGRQSALVSRTGLRFSESRQRRGNGVVAGRRGSDGRGPGREPGRFVCGGHRYQQRGDTRWQIERPRQANWSSPVITQTPQGQSIVLVKSGEGLDAHDLRSGLRRWNFPGDAGGIPSVATLPGQILLPADGVIALDLPSDGTGPQVRWSSNRINPGPASPIVSERPDLRHQSRGCVELCGPGRRQTALATASARIVLGDARLGRPSSVLHQRRRSRPGR